MHICYCTVNWKSPASRKLTIDHSHVVNCLMVLTINKTYAFRHLSKFVSNYPVPTVPAQAEQIFFKML